MKKYTINKKILQFDFFKLQNYINDYRENLIAYSNGDLKKAKKNLAIIERYRDKIVKRDKIETLTQMKNRKLDKHIKKAKNE